MYLPAMAIVSNSYTVANIIAGTIQMLVAKIYKILSLRTLASVTIAFIFLPK